MSIMLHDLVPGAIWYNDDAEPGDLRFLDLIISVEPHPDAGYFPRCVLLRSSGELETYHTELRIPDPLIGGVVPPPTPPLSPKHSPRGNKKEREQSVHEDQLRDLTERVECLDPDPE